MERIFFAVSLVIEEYRKALWCVQLLEDDAVGVPAQQRANVQSLITGSAILKETLKVYRHVCQMKALRFNGEAFETLYPAATALRTNFGDGVWESLENYRGVVTYLAYSTLREKSTAGNELPTELKAFLNENTTHMATYIRARYERHAFITFRHILDSIEEIIEGERRQGIEVQQGWPMKFLLSKFSRQPIFWLMYNLNFPVEGRMSWGQLSIWAIQRLRNRDDIEPPTWPIELQGLEAWNRDATGMWNEAVIEVFTDIRQRFSAIRRLHFTL